MFILLIRNIVHIDICAQLALKQVINLYTLFKKAGNNVVTVQRLAPRGLRNIYS